MLSALVAVKWAMGFLVDGAAVALRVVAGAVLQKQDGCAQWSAARVEPKVEHSPNPWTVVKLFEIIALWG